MHLKHEGKWVQSRRLENYCYRLLLDSNKLLHLQVLGLATV